MEEAIYYGRYLIDSQCYDSEGTYKIRPVVTLGPNVKISACIGENSIDNMHVIEKYE